MKTIKKYNYSIEYIDSKGKIIVENFENASMKSINHIKNGSFIFKILNQKIVKC